MTRASREPVHSAHDEDEELWLDDEDIESDAAAIVSDVLDETERTGLLDERQQEILAFERQWWRQAGAKEQAIRDRFQLSTTRYYQLLNALLDEPAAIEHDPVLVKRLRRLRASRARGRSTRGTRTD